MNSDRYRSLVMVWNASFASLYSPTLAQVMPDRKWITCPRVARADCGQPGVSAHVEVEKTMLRSFQSNVTTMTGATVGRAGLAVASVVVTPEMWWWFEGIFVAWDCRCPI